MNPTPKPIRALVIEDNPDDAELLLHQFKRDGQAVEAGVATDFPTARDLFTGCDWDIVLSDYNLPGTKFSDILAMVKDADADLPVIVVSGAVGEEVAVALMREGASDLILKHNLTRLVPAVTREIKFAEHAHARRESERRFRDIVEASADWIWETDAEHRLRFSADNRDQPEWSDPFRSLGRTLWDAVGADIEGDANWNAHKRLLGDRQPFHGFRFRFSSPTGHQYHISMSGVPAFTRTGAFAGYRGTATDETLVVETYMRAEEAESLLRDGVESIAQGILITDGQGRIELVNSACRDIYPEIARLLRPGIDLRAIEKRMEELGLVLKRRDAATDAGVHDDASSQIVCVMADGRRLLVNEGVTPTGGRVQIHVDISGLGEDAGTGTRDARATGDAREPAAS